jgi:hypothetical protein
MKTEIVSLAVTIAAAAALSRFRLVDFSGNPAAAGERALGVAVTSFSTGEQAGVAVRGELLVEAGAAIAVGAQVESDASAPRHYAGQRGCPLAWRVMPLRRRATLFACWSDSGAPAP